MPLTSGVSSGRWAGDRLRGWYRPKAARRHSLKTILESGSLKVINYTFHDVDDSESWQPEDVYDFDQWMMATVGDENGGSNFQLHICTPVSISRMESKRHVFMIDRWEGIPTLIGQLNDFIQNVEADTVNVLEYELAKHWAWEYDGM